MPPKQYHYSSPPLTTSPNMTGTVTMTNSTFPFVSPVNQSTMMTPSRSNDDVAAFDKRSAHNALERQRREGLNTKFQQLAHALPELQNVKRPSKSMIVAKSLEFVAKSIQKDSSYKKKILQLRKEHEVLRKHTKMSQQQIRKRLLDDTSTTSGLTIHVPQPSSVTLKKSSSVSPKEEKENPPSMKRHKSNKHSSSPSPSSSSSSPKSPTHSVALPPTITNNVSKKVNQGNKNNPLPMMPLQQSPLPLNIFPVINESWPPLDISAFQNTSQSSMSHIYDPYIVQQQQHLISQPSSISTNPVDINTKQKSMAELSPPKKKTKKNYPKKKILVLK
ncbi:hypothetical protein BJ944DRAFT_287781 [Cunninghamella echinulata]|nr:hypothetical protein BJ944DRAFT_287781 [Cunninghamella echinulata]